MLPRKFLYLQQKKSKKGSPGRAKYVILITRRWKGVAWGDQGLLDYSLEQAWNDTRAQLLEHLYYSFEYISIIIHYNLSTPTD